MSRRTAFESFYTPNSVAVIGATDREGTVGRTVVANLCNGKFQGRVYAVNPKRSEILGLRCYANIAAVPEKVDLVVDRDAGADGSWCDPRVR